MATPSSFSPRHPARVPCDMASTAYTGDDTRPPPTVWPRTRARTAEISASRSPLALRNVANARAERRWLDRRSIACAEHRRRATVGDVPGGTGFPRAAAAAPLPTKRLSRYRCIKASPGGCDRPPSEEDREHVPREARTVVADRLEPAPFAKGEPPVAPLDVCCLASCARLPRLLLRLLVRDALRERDPSASRRRNARAPSTRTRSPTT